MRRRRSAGLIAVVALLVLGLPTPALAQTGATNPFAPGLPSAPAPAPTVSTPAITSPTTAGGGGGLSSGSAIAIAVGAILLLGGISFFIWRDARRRAPVRRRAALATSGDASRARSKQRVKPRKLSPAERRRRKRGRAR